MTGYIILVFAMRFNVCFGNVTSFSLFSNSGQIWTDGHGDVGSHLIYSCPSSLSLPHVSSVICQCCEKLLPVPAVKVMALGESRESDKMCLNKMTCIPYYGKTNADEDELEV